MRLAGQKNFFGPVGSGLFPYSSGLGRAGEHLNAFKMGSCWTDGPQGCLRAESRRDLNFRSVQASIVHTGLTATVEHLVVCGLSLAIVSSVKVLLFPDG